MIDTFEIGCRLILNDDITKDLDGVARQFSVIDDAIIKVNAALAQTQTTIADLASASAGLASSWHKAAEAAERMAQAVSGAGLGGGGGYPGVPGIPGGGDEPAYLPGGNLPAIIPGQGAYGPGGAQSWGHVPFPGGRGEYQSQDSDPNGYRPNWRYGQEGDDALFNGGGPVPFYPGQSRSVGGGSLVDTYFFGSLAYGIAKDAIAGPFDAAATVDQKLAVLRANGMSASEAQDSYELAQRMQQNPQYKTLTIDDLLGILQGGFLQTRSVAEAQGIMPVMANAATVLQGIGAAGVQEQIFDLLRSGDLAGLLNDKGADGQPDLTRLKKFVSTFTDIELATGDAVSPSQMVRLFQNLGPAALSMDEQGLGTTMLMALSLGQLKTGTGINQLFKELAGGKMSKATEEFLVKQGLLNPNDIIGHSADYVQMGPGALVDDAGFLADPEAWIVQHIGGALKADSPADRQKLISTIYASAGTVQGSRVVAESIFQNALLMRYLTGASQLAPLDELAGQFDNTPTGVAAGAKSAGNAVLVTLSNQTMTQFESMLSVFTEVSNSASNWMNGHPTETVIGVATAGYGVVLGLLKAAAHWNIPGAGGAAGLLGRIFEPLLWVEGLYETVGPGSEKRMDKLGHEIGLPGWMTDPSLSNGIVTGILSAIANQTQAIENQTQKLVAAINGKPAPYSTQMPTGPTGHHPRQSMPMPGLAGHQY